MVVVMEPSIPPNSTRKQKTLEGISRISVALYTTEESVGLALDLTSPLHAREMTCSTQQPVLKLLGGLEVP